MGPVDTGKVESWQINRSNRMESCVEKFPKNGMFMKRNIFFSYSRGIDLESGNE